MPQKGSKEINVNGFLLVNFGTKLYLVLTKLISHVNLTGVKSFYGELFTEVEGLSCLEDIKLFSFLCRRAAMAYLIL